MNLKAEKTRDDQDEDLNEEAALQTPSFSLNDWRNSIKAVISVVTLKDRRQT